MTAVPDMGMMLCSALGVEEGMAKITIPKPYTLNPGLFKVRHMAQQTPMCAVWALQENHRRTLCHPQPYDCTTEFGG